MGNMVKPQDLPCRDRSGPVRSDQGTLSLDDPRLYINRELSWLAFNQRILEEAEDHSHPLLERIKFLAICGSNLDEFFMSRVPGLQRQAIKGALEAPPDRMSPTEQLSAIHEVINKLLEEYSTVWNKHLVSELSSKGIHVRRVEDLSADELKSLRSFFEENLFPILTPLAIDVNHPFPFISSLAINLAVVVKDPAGHEKLARLKVPSGLFPRLVKLDKGKADKSGDIHFVLLEDIVAANLDMLFPGMKVLYSYPFRATRDAENRNRAR